VNVLVDTPVWSLALHRGRDNLNSEERHLVKALTALIQEGRAQIIGPIRQELLSGIRSEKQFHKLRQYLRTFDEPGLGIPDYEEAARMSNLCRGRGIAGSAIDFLICSIAHRSEWEILTTDRDFSRYAKVLSLRLYHAA
jgi:predicted nucleic acid-binding protein